MNGGSPFNVVMPGLVPGIHVLSQAKQDVDGRVKPGHDAEVAFAKVSIPILRQHRQR